MPSTIAPAPPDTSRADLIARITATFPADAPDPKTAALGNKLWLRAENAVPRRWYESPTPVLAEYARLCDEQAAAS